VVEEEGEAGESQEEGLEEEAHGAQMLVRTRQAFKEMVDAVGEAMATRAMESLATSPTKHNSEEAQMSVKYHEGQDAARRARERTGWHQA
jgi:hypothetical protein